MRKPAFHLVAMIPSFLLLFFTKMTASVVMAASSSSEQQQQNWVDPDTPPQYYTTKAFYESGSGTYYSNNDNNNNDNYRLVFSDEFEQEGRLFGDGNDPRWTALDKDDVTNNPLHYYSSDAVQTTSRGVLKLTLSDDNPNEEYNNKNFQSGMLQSWNKFCFTGGIVEVSAKLPGRYKVGGLWPAIWMMGNLARATYVPSTEKIWPYSTNVCDNRTRHAQEINSCTSARGRGAAEIDLMEAMYMKPWTYPVASASLQVAPGVDHHRPVPGHVPNASHVWYQDIEYGNETGASLNTYFYGVKIWHTHEEEQNNHPSFQTDAISANLLLNESHYLDQHVYRLEWEPPTITNQSAGYLRWYLDGKLIQGVRGESLERLTQTQIPNEPMYLLANIAVSKDWGFPDAYYKNCPSICYDCSNPACRACALPEGFCENLPTSMEIDYVRVYQAPHHVLGCSPETRPTEAFIQQHVDRYTDDKQKKNGQQQPLQPISRGGAWCWRNNDCGGSNTGADGGFQQGGGSCSWFKRCRCAPGRTGPTCRAYDPFFSNKSGNSSTVAGSNSAIPDATTENAPKTIVLLGCAACLLALLILKRQRHDNKRASSEQYTLLPDVQLVSQQQRDHSRTNGNSSY